MDKFENCWPVAAVVFSSLCVISTADQGLITTWKGDATGDACKNFADPTQCDEGKGTMLCSAPMKTCKCQGHSAGKEYELVPAYKTANKHRFKQWCYEEQIDGRKITDDDRRKCLNCAELTCDQEQHPDCSEKVSCGRQTTIKVNGQSLNTIEMDTCPSNHQKNVAKCCMWEGEYCSCIRSGDWLDVNAEAMKRLKQMGYASGMKAEWSFSNQPSQGDGSVGCTDLPPDDKHSCKQQAEWGKCGQSFMANHCMRSCGRCDQAICIDAPPDNRYTCQQQAGFKQCSAGWMIKGNFCRKTCGRC